MLHGLSCGACEICEFLNCLIKHTAAAHAYVSPWALWFILGAMSSSRPRGFLLVSFWKTRLNEKKIKWKKKLQEKWSNGNERNANKMKTKWKQKQIEQNKKVKKIEQK